VERTVYRALSLEPLKFMSEISVIAWALGICTIFGGIAAAWFFWDKIADRPPAVERLRRRAEREAHPQAILDLPYPALRLAVERKPFWEFRLLAWALANELTKAGDLKNRLRYGNPLVERESLTAGDFLDSISSRTSALSALYSAYAPIAEALTEGLGPPGVAGDPIVILESAKRLGEIYRAAHEWSLVVASTFPNPVSIYGICCRRCRSRSSVQLTS
jgi:hypothetical protein